MTHHLEIYQLWFVWKVEKNDVLVLCMLHSSFWILITELDTAVKGVWDFLWGHGLGINNDHSWLNYHIWPNTLGRYESECKLILGGLAVWICATSEVLPHQSDSKNLALIFFWSAVSAFLLGFKQTELLNSSVEVTIKGSMPYIATIRIQNKVKSWGKCWLIEKRHSLDIGYQSLCVVTLWCWCS